MPAQEQPDPCLIVIFGASGDLTKRKLIPSLQHLHATGVAPSCMGVVGVSRTPMSDEEFRQHLEDFQREQQGAKFDEKAWRDFAPRVHYHAADGTKLEDYDGLKQRLNELADAHSTGENLLFYLSVAPQLYEPTIDNLGAAQMITEGRRWCSLNRETAPWQRIVIEKPFGSDTATAAALNRTLGRVFEEESIYRIDHYLGKETVQNLLVFRFANAIFEPIWNRNYIDHVQVTAVESVGVEGRGGYYDSPNGGAMRDMIQSHLLQVLAVTAMEPPVSMDAEQLRAEKNKVLTATRTPSAEKVDEVAVKGQYGPGTVKGERVPGFRDEEGVAADSQTDTYAAFEVHVDNWRWRDVPFFLRSGKRMARKLTQIVVQFKPTPHCLFDHDGRCESTPAPNRVLINIQPEEGITLRFDGKTPGRFMHTQPVDMRFNYVEAFGGEPPEAYATLLLDAMRGDQSQYKNRHEVEEAWRIVQPILDHWAEHPDAGLPNYAAGSWGPEAADRLLARTGRKWHNP